MRNAQRYIQDRMVETGYVAESDTLSAPSSVTDSLAIMSRRFEEATVETDRDALKEEVLEAISSEDSPTVSSEGSPVISSEGEAVVEKSAAVRKEEDE